MKRLLKTFIPDALIRALWHLPRAVFSSALFCFPSRAITCIAVAGTKGKTSTAFFLSYLLNTAGQKTALFSTAAIHDGAHQALNARKMTTPDSWSVQSFLRRAVTNGCKYAVLEVSSHALKQHRVWGIPFTLVIITNLAPDHLDYHTSAEEYQQVHSTLFSKKTRVFCHSEKFSVISGLSKNRCGSLDSARDDKEGARDYIFQEKAALPLSCSAWWMPLQQANINAALCAARSLSCSEDALARALETLPCPPGRFESIDEGQPFRVIVDYAHSPESLEYFLSRIRPLVAGSLIVVFGACGDRDKTQRPLMGELLERYADRTILTTDDPYSENPADIARNVEYGFKKKEYAIILDRKEAIRNALFHAHPNDGVCILGKGAEQWQIFRDRKIAWDDRNVARQLLKRR